MFYFKISPTFLLISVYHPSWFPKGGAWNGEELKIMTLISNCIFLYILQPAFKMLVFEKGRQSRLIERISFQGKERAQTAQ